MSTPDSDIPFALGRSKEAKGLTPHESRVAYTLIQRKKNHTKKHYVY